MICLISLLLLSFFRNTILVLVDESDVCLIRSGKRVSRIFKKKKKKTVNSLHSLDYKDVFQQGEGVREGKALQQER